MKSEALFKPEQNQNWKSVLALCKHKLEGSSDTIPSKKKHFGSSLSVKVLVKTGKKAPSNVKSFPTNLKLSNNIYFLPNKLINPKTQNQTQKSPKQLTVNWVMENSRK